MLSICLRATWIFLIISLLNRFVVAKSSDTRVVCYYTNWSVYRAGSAKFTPQNINPYLCTHLIYAFGGFTKDGALKPFDKYQDIDKGGYAKFTGLKTYNKHLKTLIAVGGWNEGSTKFSSLSNSPEKRLNFTKNVVKFLRQNSFDGLDLDWEYPAARDGGKARDKENYATLVKELREEFEREAEKTGRSRLLLTMAAPAGTNYIEKGYNIPKLNRYLDWFNILSYDYHSSHEPLINHHAPLLPLEEENEYSLDAGLNIEHSINYYLNAGADPDKIVLGIPTYGRSYTLINPEATDIGSPAEGPGEKGEFTKEKGYLAYYEICHRIRDDDWTVVDVDENAMGPVAFKDDQWVGYDDEEMARKKSQYVVKKGLGGIMFWSIDNDDFRGDCHGKPFPIIEAAKQALLDALGITEITFEEEPEKPSKSKSKGTIRQKVSKPEASTEAPRTTTSRSSSAGTRARTNQVRASTTPRPPSADHRTTPAPPTTPSSEGDFTCEDEGFFPHPKDCKKYYWCLDGGASGLGLVAHQFTCPSGLYFNPAADSCDYTRNVLCKKQASTTTTTTTTEATTTTTRSTTQRTTTAQRPSQSFTNLITRNNLLRNRQPTTAATTTTTTTQRPTRPSTTTTTTTPAPVEEDSDGEEDPRIIKELIELIKKAGGLEQLEKQFNFRSDDSSEKVNPSVAPAAVSKSLYQRVLNKALALTQNKREYGSIVRSTTAPPPTTTSTTPTYRKPSTSAPLDEEVFAKPTYTNTYRNSRPKPQNDGIDKLPEFEGTLKEKPKYVTLVRPKAEGVATAEDDVEYSYEIVSVEDEDDDLGEDPLQATSRPSYIDTNRLRALKQEINVEEINAATEPTGAVSSPRYTNIQRQKVSTEEATTTPKYKVIERTRSSTLEEVPTTTQVVAESSVGVEITSRSTPSPSPIETVSADSNDRYRLVGESAESDLEDEPETTARAYFSRSTSARPDSAESNQKVSETVFIITRPSQRQTTDAPARSTRRRPEQSEVRSSTPTSRRRTSVEPRPSRTRSSTLRYETTRFEEVPETTLPSRQRTRNRYSRPSSRDEIQSATVYAPRPFLGSRTTEGKVDRDDVTFRPRQNGGGGRGTARRGPSRAFTSEDDANEVQTQAPLFRPRQKAAPKQDDGPLNFLVPDRAVNPSSRFSLTSGFSTNRRETTPRTIVEEAFDINTANPNVQGGPFPSVADIKEDTVILTLGGQLAVASPAQNSLQARINEELAKLGDPETVAPYSVTISSLAPDSTDYDDYETQTSSRLASAGTTRLTPVRTRLTTIVPSPTPRSIRRRPTQNSDVEDEEITQTIARLLTSGVPSSYTHADYATISDLYSTQVPTTDSPTFVPTTTTTTTTQAPTRSRKIKKIRRTRPSEAQEETLPAREVRRRPQTTTSTTTTTASPVKTRGTLRRLVKKRPVTTTTTRTTTQDELETEEEDLDINIDNNIQRQSTGRFSDPSEFSRPTRRFQAPGKVEAPEEKTVEVRPTRPRFLLRTTTTAPEVSEDENIELNFAVPDEDILNSVTSTKATNRFTARPSLRPLNRFSLKPKAEETANKEPSNTVKISTTRRPPSYRSKPTFGRPGATTSTETPVGATKNSKLFSRNRNRNYVNRFRGGEEAKKESENEIERTPESTEVATVEEIRDAGTTNIPTTTLKHVFSIDETSTQRPSEPGDTAEEISKKLEKLVEINIIEEVNTRTEKHKKSSKTKDGKQRNTTEVTLEKLPTNHKVGEISRLSIIKLLNGDDDKKSRILSSDAIFKTETSTIPLERLFELERQAKELRDLSTTDSPMITPVYIHETTLEDATSTTQNVPTTYEGTTQVDNEILGQPAAVVALLDGATVQKANETAPLISSGYSQTTK